MITVSVEPVPKAKSEALIRWLSMDEFNTLLNIIASKVKRAEAEALRDAIQAEVGNAKLDVANSKLAIARKCQNCIDVLREIASDTATHQIVRLN